MSVRLGCLALGVASLACTSTPAGTTGSTSSTAGSQTGSSSGATSSAQATSGAAGATSSGAAGLTTSGGQPTRILLFGGADESDAGVLGDTWTWDGTSWTAHDVPGPAPRQNAVAGAFGNQVVLFSGVALLLDGGEVFATDTWIWDGASWTQQNVQGPSARELAQGGTLNGDFVLYGGYNAEADGTNDVWTWDGGQWTQILPDTDPVEGLNGSPITELLLATASFDGGIFFTAGASSWVWDGGWTFCDAGPSTGALPGAGALLQGAGAAALGDTIFLFGGFPYGGFSPTPGSQTWTWHGSSWTSLSPPLAPAARSEMGMASLNGQALLFGGTVYSDAGITNEAGITYQIEGDTWTWDGGAWTLLNVTGPSPRTGAVMVAY